MGHLFGPVPSRRLGLSLGVDLVPYKTCTYDCIYCQLGATARRTLRRAALTIAAEVEAELRSALRETRADYVTLSGSGEPTLCQHLDRIIGSIKDLTDIPVAVLTNGSLLSRADVRRELAGADLVVPSLDAVSPEVYAAVNRPAVGLHPETVIEGIRKFADGFTGRILLEVMLVAGVNDGGRELASIAAAAGKIRAEKVQLNTVERPPAKGFARALTPDELERARLYFDDRAEIIAETAARDRTGFAGGEVGLAVLELLRRRPCTAADVATGLGLHRNIAVKLLGDLLQAGLIAAEVLAGGKTYYRYRA